MSSSIHGCRVLFNPYNAGTTIISLPRIYPLIFPRDIIVKRERRKIRQTLIIVNSRQVYPFVPYPIAVIPIHQRSIKGQYTATRVERTCEFPPSIQSCQTTEISKTCAELQQEEKKQGISIHRLETIEKPEASLAISHVMIISRWKPVRKAL